MTRPTVDLEVIDAQHRIVLTVDVPHDNVWDVEIRSASRDRLVRRVLLDNDQTTLHTPDAGHVNDHAHER